MSKLFYGVSSQKEMVTHIRRACELVRAENVPDAMNLMIGTCCAETGLCTVRDIHFAQGKGPFQFDSNRFFDVKMRTLNEKPILADKIKEETGIDLARVDYSMLDYAPLVGAIMCRLGYLFVPMPIPKTLRGQALYWKTYWNSAAGKGTPEHYEAMVNKHWGGVV